MIKVNGIEIKADIFPDKTSQVWKLPDEFFNSAVIDITWEFHKIM